jgi:hypothetical protein
MRKRPVEYSPGTAHEADAGVGGEVYEISMDATDQNTKGVDHRARSRKRPTVACGRSQQKSRPELLLGTAGGFPVSQEMKSLQ